MLETIVAGLALALILLVVAWQAALLQKWEPRRRAERDAATAARAQQLAVSPTPTDPLGRFVDVLRRRKWARRGLSGMSATALVVALLFLGFPFYTNLIQDQIQARLSHQLHSPQLREAYLEHRLQEGDSLTRIRIPSIGVDVVVVEGTGADALRAGAGHYRSTPLPCENGNVGIAGHRTTYGRPFANLDLLKPGDQIILDTPIGSCTYVVSPTPSGRQALDANDGPFVVNPNDIGVVANSSTPMLTLTTCHPKGSAAKRLVVQAARVSDASTTPSTGGT